jgi:hypothetical protein
VFQVAPHRRSDGHERRKKTARARRGWEKGRAERRVAWYEQQVPDVLYVAAVWVGGTGGCVMMAEGSGTDHAGDAWTARVSPRPEGGWGSKRTPFRG